MCPYKVFGWCQENEKVGIDEIKNIVEIMKYRVIGTETTPEDLKDILGFNMIKTMSRAEKLPNPF